jgi:GntR family transcriptional regulator
MDMSGSATLGESAYRRVAFDLRNQIQQGRFRRDEALPTEAELTERYEVSRQTVRRAFLDLVAEGLVFRVPGRGTFVTPPENRYVRQFGSVEDLMALSADSNMQVISPLADLVDLSAASRLRLPDDRVATAAFIRLHYDAPFSHTRVYMPPAVRQALGEASELAHEGEVSRTTVIAMLDRVLPAPIRNADQSITVSKAPVEAAESLGVATGVSLLRIDRTYFDTESRPVELAISHFRPDRYSYRTRLQRSGS